MLTCWQVQSAETSSIKSVGEGEHLGCALRLLWHTGRVLLERGLWFGLEESQVEPRDVRAKNNKRNGLEDTPKCKSACHCEKVEDHWKVLQNTSDGCCIGHDRFIAQEESQCSENAQ